MNRSQSGSPILVSADGRRCRTLKPLDLAGDSAHRYDENWLQEKIFAHPSLLPVDDIDPVFGKLIPVCRELMTVVGPLDNLYVNELGMLTLVECKLWRNPEARRKVVGQILDYAQEFSRMDYDDLIARINRRTGRSGNSLYEIVADQTEGISEKAFTESAMKNLKRGRFLLLIVGDGIRENVENISTYLQDHAHLNFTFALVEQSLYRFDGDEDSDILIQPRILARSVEIERAVIRVEGGNVEPVKRLLDDAKVRGEPQPRRKTITEQVFLEQMAQSDPELVKDLQKLFAEVTERDLILDPGAGGISVKSPGTGFNFLSFRNDGSIRNYGAGLTQEGREYIDRLAGLLDRGTVRVSTNDGFHTTIQRIDGSDFRVGDILRNKDQWLKLVEETQAKLQEA